MSDEHEFLGEYPAFAPAPLFTGDAPKGPRKGPEGPEPGRAPLPARGYVSGNYVAEPGAYACVHCRDALPPPHVLKSGDRLPECPRCGPEARWTTC